MKSLPTPSAVQQRAFSVNETATILGVGHGSIRRMIQRGVLKPVRVLRTLIIPASEIDRLLNN